MRSHYVDKHRDRRRQFLDVEWQAFSDEDAADLSMPLVTEMLAPSVAKVTAPNIDAVKTAGRFGIAPDRAQSFHSDGEGTAINYCVVSEAVASFRACAAMQVDWNEEIEADFKKREMKKR